MKQIPIKCLWLDGINMDYLSLNYLVTSELSDSKSSVTNR